MISAGRGSRGSLRVPALLGVIAALCVLAATGPFSASGVVPEPGQDAERSDAASVVVGAGGVFESISPVPETHAWFYAPVPQRGSDAGSELGAGSGDGEGGEAGPVMLIHLPPRQASLHGGAPGVGRLSRYLELPPIGIAASGRRVYLLGRGDGEPSRYLVRTIEAEPAPLPGVWTDFPEGMMTSLPPLEIDGQALGFAATASGPCALVRTDRGLVLALFSEDAWKIEPLPGDAAGEMGDAPVLLASPRVFAVVGGGSVLFYDRGAWDLGETGMPGNAVPVGLLGRSVVAWSRVGDAGESGLAADVLVASDAGSQRITRVTLPVDTAFLGLVLMNDASGRLIIAHAERREAAGARFAVHEVSLATGEVLYDGLLEPVRAVTAAEFLILASGLVVMMVISLVVVLWSGRRQPVLVLPDGCALATPGRRMMATLLDVLVCSVIVGRVSGVPVGEIIGMGVLLRPDQAWLTIPGVLVAGFVYGTISEALFGVTLGKAAMGCRVVRTDAGGAVRVGLVRSLIRNAVKWLLPPAASLALVEPTGRHRGDQLAGASVAIRTEHTESD